MLGNSGHRQSRNYAPFGPANGPKHRQLPAHQRCLERPSVLSPSSPRHSASFRSHMYAPSPPWQPRDRQYIKRPLTVHLRAPPAPSLPTPKHHISIEFNRFPFKSRHFRTSCNHPIPVFPSYLLVTEPTYSYHTMHTYVPF